jgi:hypothetical protein
MPKEAGRIIVTDPGSDKPLAEVGTLQCCHCGGHWIPQPGSGRVRGFCQNCNGFVCGPGCAACVPAEQLLENIEKGRPLDFKPICVPVSFGGGE